MRNRVAALAHAQQKHRVPQARAMLYKINFDRAYVSAILKTYMTQRLHVSWLVQDTLGNKQISKRGHLEAELISIFATTTDS